MIYSVLLAFAGPSSNCADQAQTVGLVLASFDIVTWPANLTLLPKSLCMFSQLMGVLVFVQERRMLIETCQEISAAQCIRISFLSGDVHVCAAGRLYSDPKVKNIFFLSQYLAVDSHAS